MINPGRSLFERWHNNEVTVPLTESGIKSHEHPPYGIVDKLALLMIRNNSEIFMQSKRIKESGLLECISLFYSNATDRAKFQGKKLPEPRIDSTMHGDQNETSYVEPMWKHFVRMAGENPRNIPTDILKNLLTGFAAMLQSDNLKSEDIWWLILSAENQKKADAEHGLGTIDKLGGVYELQIPINLKPDLGTDRDESKESLSSLENPIGTIAKRALGKLTLGFLANQRRWAGSIPSDKPLNLHSTRNKADEIIKEIEQNGWDKYLGFTDHDLNTHARKVDTHPELTNTNDQTLFMLNGKPELIDCDLLMHELDAIRIRVYAPSTTQEGTITGWMFADLPITKTVGLSGFEIEKLTAAHVVISNSVDSSTKRVSLTTNDANIPWRPIEYSVDDNETARRSQPLFSLSVSTGNAKIDEELLKYRASQGRSLTHLDFNGNHLNMFAAHVPSDAVAQVDFLQSIKNAIGEELLGQEHIEQFIRINPPLPSVKPNKKFWALSPDNPLALIVENFGIDPPPELTTLQLEKLGLTDIEFGMQFDHHRLQKAINNLNDAWVLPLNEELRVYMEDPNFNRELENLMEKYSADLGAIGLENPMFASDKVKFKIMALLNPQINRSQMFGFQADRDGPTVYCGMPIQTHKRLGLIQIGALNVTEGLEAELFHAELGYEKNIEDAAYRARAGYMDIRDPELLKIIKDSILETATDQTYTLLGISPTGFLAAMTHNFTRLAESTAKILNRVLKNEADSQTQISDVKKSGGSWFKSAMSQFRNTIARAIGINDKFITWRLNTAKPAFFETLPISNVNLLEIPSVLQLLQGSSVLSNEEIQNASELAKKAKSIWDIELKSGRKRSNANRLAYFYSVAESVQSRGVRKDLHLSLENDIAKLKSDLYAGLKILIIASCYNKMEKSIKSTIGLTENLVKLASKPNLQI